MNEHKEKPEVYALRQDDGNWKISRRDFLKVVGIGTAAALVAGLNKAAAQDTTVFDACMNAAADTSSIHGLAVSADGKYLLSRSFENIRCWDLTTGRSHMRTAARYTSIIPTLMLFSAFHLLRKRQ